VAARAIPEMNVTELIPQLHALCAGTDGLVSVAAHDALHEMNEVNVMETLQTMSVMERVLLLHDIPLFTALAPDDLAQIAAIAREQWHDDGSVICREGEQGREMYVLAQGQVRVTKHTAEGEKYLAARYAGDFLGEMSIILTTPRTSSVYADGAVRTLVISAEAFTTILHDRPSVALATLRGVMQRLREMQARLPVIGDVRGQGLFAIVELAQPSWPQTLPQLKKLVSEGRKSGISFAVRGNLIVISPPLVIAQEDFAHGIDVMEELLGSLL